MKKQDNSNEKKTTEENSEKKERRFAYAYKQKNTSETFWNLLRINNNLTLKELSELTGYKIGNLSLWLTGKYRPDDNVIKVLCDLFNVPFDEGKLQFEMGFNTYHHRKIGNEPPEKACEWVREDIEKYSPKKIEPAKKPVVKEEEVKLEEKHTPVGKSIFELVYGKLSFEAFDNLVTIMSLAEIRPDVNFTEAILKEIYGKVDYDDYQLIMKLIGRTE